MEIILNPKGPGTSKSEVLAERTLKGPIAEKLYVNVEFLRPNVGIFLIIMDHEVCNPNHREQSVSKHP